MSGGPPPVPGGRSPDDREAARRARDSRRSGRTETPAPPPPRNRDWIGEARTMASERVPRSARPSRNGSEGPRSHWGRIIFALVAGLLLLGVLWFANSLFQPLHGDGDGTVRVTIPKGASLGTIGALLEKQGVVSSSFFFHTRARIAGKGNDLKPGVYKLKRDMKYMTALNVIAKGPPPDVVNLTIPEGRSRAEVAKLVPSSIRGSYVAATRRSGALDPRKYGAKNATSLEGFLFPATYELKRGKPVRALVEQQLSTFRQKFSGVNFGYARSKNLNKYEVLIVASMVEREASLDKERPIIASVIYNRLKQGIPLGIDATIRFATGNWEHPLKQSELAINSPYNTRKNQGLPPGPIGSPGIASIEAAARPAKTNYLFYVVKPCGRGEHAFSSTDAQFQADVQKYDTERARQGGKSPVNC